MDQLQMLVEFLGSDLSKINNELEKLMIILPQGSTITPKIIEDNIGISKDYNVFELRKALGERDELKAYKKADAYCTKSPSCNIIIAEGPQAY